VRFIRQVNRAKHLKNHLTVFKDLTQVFFKYEDGRLTNERNFKIIFSMKEGRDMVL